MMDFVNEGIALGVDLIILGFCVKEYMFYKRTIITMKAAPQLSINRDLRAFIAMQPDQRIPYAFIRGSVKPIGVPIRSVLSPAVSGVMQIIKLREHRIARSIAGFWTDQQTTIHTSSNDTPFRLHSNGEGVEIVNPLSAALFDLDVVYDNYEPSSPTNLSNVFGFFTGLRQKGFQTTEEILREGSIVTAIGELELDGNNLRMQSGSLGPLYLTTSTKAAFVKKFETLKTSAATRIIILSLVATGIAGYIARKFYLRKLQEREDLRIRETLERERRARRALARPENLPTEQSCVVCSTNPKEIIILPCGHVCLCEDCAERIRSTCPVCRGKIAYKAAAFIT